MMSVEFHTSTLYEKKFLNSIDDNLLDQFLVFSDVDERVRATARAYVAWYKTHSLEEIAHIAEVDSVDTLTQLLHEADEYFKAELAASNSQQERKGGARRSQRNVRGLGKAVSLHVDGSETIATTEETHFVDLDVHEPVRVEKTVVVDLRDDSSETLDESDAVCRHLPPEEMNKFTSSTYKTKVEAAKHCTDCKFRKKCLEIAVDAPLYLVRTMGVYGGLHGRKLEKYVEAEKLK